MTTGQKCGDALHLGSKGRHGSFHLWINVWVAGKLCDPSLTHAIPERLSGEMLMIKHYTKRHCTLWTTPKTILPLLTTFLCVKLQGVSVLFSVLQLRGMLVSGSEQFTSNRLHLGSNVTQLGSQ